MVHHHTDLIDRPILILGVPRSGTSLVAGVLQLCGAWLGETVPGGVHNPKGFFENIVLREAFNKSMLLSLGCDPLGVQSLPPLKGLPLSHDIQAPVVAALQDQGYAGDRPWLFKDAKLTLLWPLWQRAFPQARWLIVRRKTDDIIRSCLNTDFMAQHSLDPKFWKKWIAQYLQRLEALKASGVWYRELWPQGYLNGDAAPLNAIVRELGLTWSETKVRQFIEPGHWHGKVSR